MNDTELSEPEATRLSELLHRAADGLEVHVPDQMVLPPRASRAGRRPWLLAAAALVVVAGMGAAWWAGTDEGDRLDTGPAEPVDPALSNVIDQSGIWRLPDGLDGYRVVAVSEAGAASSSSYFMVDDVDAPSRWLMLDVDGGRLDDGAGVRAVELDDDRTIRLAPLDDDRTTWFTLHSADDWPVLAGAYEGLDDDQVIDLLDGVFTASALSDRGRLRHAIVKMDPPQGLDKAFDPAPVEQYWDDNVEEGITAIEVTLLGDDGAEVVVGLQGSDLPPAVAALQLRLAYLQMKDPLERSAAELGYELDHTLTPRPDLGPHVLESRSEFTGRPPMHSLVLFAGDGTMINVFKEIAVDGLERFTLDGPELTEAEQLRILAGLRSMSEAEFRDELTRRGAEMLESGSSSVGPDGAVTTIVGG